MKYDRYFLAEMFAELMKPLANQAVEFSRDMMNDQPSTFVCEMRNRRKPEASFVVFAACYTDDGEFSAQLSKKLHELIKEEYYKRYPQLMISQIEENL